MNFKNWSLFKTIPISSSFDMCETSSHFIFRGSRELHYVEKETFAVSSKIEIPLDHEFGYKLLAANDNACFVVVHSEGHPSGDAVFGNPKIAFLKSFSQEKLNWEIKLNGWTIGANYGGLFLFGDRIVLTEKKDEKLETLLIDINSKDVVKKIEAQNYIDHNGSRVGTSCSLIDKENNVLYTTHFDNGIYKISLSNNDLISELLFESEPKTISQNTTHLYCNGWKGDDNCIFKIDKNDNVVTEFKIDDEIDIERMIPTNNHNKIIIVHGDYHISCYDLLSGKKSWVKAEDDDTEIYQAVIDDDGFVYLFWRRPNTFVQIVEIATGNVVQEINSSEDKFEYPFFLFKNHLFVADFRNVYCYTR